MTVGRLVVFHRGRRIEKKMDPEEGMTRMKELVAKGHKAHYVYKTTRSLFPPVDDNLALMNDGMMWCPFCRRWRWFKVPKFKDDVPFGCNDWYLNSFHRQEIRVCAWCHISEMDFDVRRANGSWGEDRKRRRRKRRRR